MTDAEVLKESMRQAIEAMSPEERRELARSLCSGVNDLAVAIVENADALWAAAALAPQGVPKHG